MKVDRIVELKEVFDFLVSRNLIKQYKKCKEYLLAGYFQNIKFKLRQPKKDKIYYFRINKKYRALCILKDNELRVFEINDHQ